MDDLIGNEPLVGGQTSSTSGSVSVGGAITSGTAGRVLFEDTGPVLADDAALLFDKSTGTLSATILKGTSLTAGRVPFAGAGGILVDDADLTFATDTLTAAKMVASTSLTVSTLTSGRVPFAGASGLLGDAAGMTYATASGLTLLTDDAATTTVLDVLTLKHTSSGTAAAGFGTGILLQAESAGGTLRSVGELQAVLTTATDAGEVSAWVFKTMVAGSLIEVARFGPGSSVPQVDLSFSVGRCLLDSRSADRAVFSHQDVTATADYAIAQLATGSTQVNCKTGTNLLLRAADTTRIQINTTGIGFFATAAVALQTGPTVNITNNVTSGGTDGTIANFTDLTIYANDSAAIRNDIYQLARGLKFVSDALRAYGLIT